ncbi:MAG: response regulator, partial [Myxococcales bacterium]
MAESGPVTILNVDDNDANRYVVTRILQRAGFRVLEAATGAQALALAQQKPALIILDVKLPDISGFEVCRRVKANPETASVSVLHLSASFVESEARTQGLDGGADGYLTRPVEAPELIASVRALLRAHSAEQAASEAARQWQATFDGISDGVCLVNGAGRVLRCNRALAAMLDTTQEQLVGADAPSAVAGAVSGPDRELLLGLSSNQPVSLEFTSAGRWFRLKADPVSRSGDGTAAVYILTDVTLAHRAEHERSTLLAAEKAARAAAEAAEQRARFLAKVSAALDLSMDYR